MPEISISLFQERMLTANSILKIAILEAGIRKQYLNHQWSSLATKGRQCGNHQLNPPRKSTQIRRFALQVVA